MPKCATADKVVRLVYYQATDLTTKTLLSVRPFSMRANLNFRIMIQPLNMYKQNIIATHCIAERLRNFPCKLQGLYSQFAAIII
jgi:hypothetical protein